MLPSETYRRLSIIREIFTLMTAAPLQETALVAVIWTKKPFNGAFFMALRCIDLLLDYHLDNNPFFISHNMIKILIFSSIYRFLIQSSDHSLYNQSGDTLSINLVKATVQNRYFAWNGLSHILITRFEWSSTFFPTFILTHLLPLPTPYSLKTYPN